MMPFLPSYRDAGPANTGMANFVYQSNTSPIPHSLNGTGTPVQVPGLQDGYALAVQSSRLSGLPGIMVPSMHTQPLTNNAYGIAG